MATAAPKSGDVVLMKRGNWKWKVKELPNITNWTWCLTHLPSLNPNNSWPGVITFQMTQQVPSSLSTWADRRVWIWTHPSANTKGHSPLLTGPSYIICAQVQALWNPNSLPTVRPRLQQDGIMSFIWLGPRPQSFRKSLSQMVPGSKIHSKDYLIFCGFGK